MTTDELKVSWMIDEKKKCKSLFILDMGKKIPEKIGLSKNEKFIVLFNPKKDRCTIMKSENGYRLTKKKKQLQLCFYTKFLPSKEIVSKTCNYFVSDKKIQVFIGLS